MTENVESYIEGLRYELTGAVKAADEAAQKAIKAELGRVTGNPVETAIAPVVTETRSE